MPRLGVVVLSRYDEYLDMFMWHFFKMETRWQETCDIVIGSDGISEDCAKKYKEMGVSVLEMPKPFNFSRNINLCVKALDPVSDLLLLNDDIIFETPNISEIVAKLLGSQPKDIANAPYGAICPALTRGEVGNGYQAYGHLPGEPYDIRPTGKICFIAVAIARRAWEATGGMDESYIGYGYDDDDWSLTARSHGFRLGVTPRLKVQHGFDGEMGTTTWKKTIDKTELDNISIANRDIFMKKWDHLFPAPPPPKVSLVPPKE